MLLYLGRTIWNIQCDQIILKFQRRFYSLLVLIVVINNVIGRIPQQLEKDEKCVGKQYYGESHMRSLQFFNEDFSEIHALSCGNPTFGPDENTPNRLCAELSPCYFFTGRYDVEWSFGNANDDEYGLNAGMFPSVTVANDLMALFWAPNKEGYPEGCDVTAIWNTFYIVDYDDRVNPCPARPEKKANENEKIFRLDFSKNHERGYPVVLMENSIITKPENLIPIKENGCNTLPPGIVCIRLVNSKIKDHADQIYPPDVEKAFDAVRKVLESKMGGEDGTPEHPRQMFNYIMLGGSFLLLIAVIASIFAIPKDHDFPIMYQKGVATVGKKAKKGKKKGDKTGNGSTGLSGIGKTGKTTTEMSGMGKSNITGGGGKKDKKNKKKGKK